MKTIILSFLLSITLSLPYAFANQTNVISVNLECDYNTDNDPKNGNCRFIGLADVISFIGEKKYTLTPNKRLSYTDSYINIDLSKENHNTMRGQSNTGKHFYAFEWGNVNTKERCTNTISQRYIYTPYNWVISSSCNKDLFEIASRGMNEHRSSRLKSRPNLLTSKQIIPFVFSKLQMYI